MNIAVVIMGFDRVEYLKRCISSIESNMHLDRYDFIYFQDGAVNKFDGDRRAEEEDIQKCLNLFEQANLPNKKKRVNKHNLGIGLQRDNVFSLFNEEYDMIIQIESDLILSQSGIVALESLGRQYPKCVSAIYSRDPDINMNIEKAQNILFKHRYSEWFSTVITEEVYREIESDWNKYLEIIDDIPYGNRPHDKIKNQFEYANVSSSDAVCNSIFIDYDITKLVTLVSRSEYIGKRGVHCTPEIYNNNFGNTTAYSFSDDFERNNWVIDK